MPTILPQHDNNQHANIAISGLSIQERLQLRLQSLQQQHKSTSLQSENHKAWIKQNLALINIPNTMLETCIEILEYMGDLKVIWLHLQECTGCSESLLRTETPSFESLIFDIFKIQYHDLVTTPSGHGAILNLEESYNNDRYVLLVEGSIPMGFAKDYITLGNRNGYDEVSHLIKHAEMVFAIGTCSSFGGIQTAYPNPTNGHALSELFDCEIINVPGCPPSDKNIIATLMYYYLLEETPKLDTLKRPMWAYGKSVHDLCERKGFFMSGDFVESFDDPNMANGYCLYKVGCKGPYTYNNCPKVKFNAKTSWPVQGGHGCIGCSEPNFWDNFGNIEKPLSNATFFTLNDKFLPKLQNFQVVSKNDSKQSPTILSTQDFLAFIQEKQFEKSIWLDFTQNQTRILLQENTECHQISEFCFEINPKLVLKVYETKNKQGKKLYENYQKHFSNTFSAIQSIHDTSIMSANLYDVFSLFLVLLENDELDSKTLSFYNKALESHISTKAFYASEYIQKFLEYANNFKFPYISDLSFKFKIENDKITLDISKALSLSMAYRIGGLDSYGICYSILCDMMRALSEFLTQYQCPIIAQGEVFSSKHAKKAFLAQNHRFIKL